MKAKPKLQVAKIKKVLKHITEDLRRLEMGIWGTFISEEELKEMRLSEKRNYPTCGTKACFAGWAVLLEVKRNRWSKLFDSGGHMHVGSISRKAQKILGLTKEEARSLFVGRACNEWEAKDQLISLKEILNNIFMEHGSKVRV